MARRFEFGDCLKLGLLREIPPSKENAKQSLKAAKEWLKECERNMSGAAYNSCILSAYLAMFHSARALLFRDGFREKSHACLARYLEAKYVRGNKLEGEWVDLLDRYRDLRHDDQYGMSITVIKEDAEEAYGTAKKFVERMTNLLGR